MWLPASTGLNAVPANFRIGQPLSPVLATHMRTSLVTDALQSPLGLLSRHGKDQ